ncbi:MAG: 30S ribosome-binding factor RbfA [Clostridia bacterium]|nr:30S ribosome-binding factor RbfA [Clostridia bacterium]
MQRRRSNVNRSDRINAELQKEIYEIISRRLKNPLITEMFSVLKVDCAKDLSYAKVYISVYSKNEEKKSATFKAIKEDAKKIRYELSKSMTVRTVPELNFILDDSMDYSDKMNKLFKEIKKGEDN